MTDGVSGLAKQDQRGGIACLEEAGLSVPVLQVALVGGRFAALQPTRLVGVVEGTVMRFEASV